MKKDILKSVIVLTVICLVISGALAVVNSFTAPVSAANAAERELKARQKLIPEATEFELYEDELPEGIISLYTAKSDAGESLGWIVTATSQGFGGAIKVMCAIGPDLKILMCETLDVSGETKTLGGQTAGSAYTDQYKGRDGSLSGVDTISGATITSTAYETCVKKAFDTIGLIGEVQ